MRHRQAKKFKGLIFVISGPSGSGKTTLAEKIIRENPAKLSKSTSLTTRPKRSGEKNGREYFFVSEEQFKQRLRAKKILEWTKYLGYYYATPKDFLEQQLEKGKNIVACLDLKGALKIKKFYPRNSVTIFILPPSLAELKRRIRQRCCLTREEEIARRLKLARREMMSAPRYDYRLVNRDLGAVAAKLKRIILNKINS